MATRIVSGSSPKKSRRDNRSSSSKARKARVPDWALGFEAAIDAALAARKSDPARKPQPGEAWLSGIQAQTQRALERRAEAAERKDGAHEKPANRLVHTNPADTVSRARQVLAYLESVDAAWRSEDADVGRDEIIGLVGDALAHVETQVRGLFTDRSAQS